MDGGGGVGAFEVEGTPIVSSVLGPRRIWVSLFVGNTMSMESLTGSIFRGLRSANLGYRRDINRLFRPLGITDVGDKF